MHTRPLKIICTVTNDLSNDQRMHRICSSLAEFGYDVCLVGRLQSKSQPLLQQTYAQKRLRCWFNSGKLFYLEYNCRLSLHLLFQKFDILNAVDLDTILPCWFSTALRRKKLTYDAHEYFSEVPEVIGRPLTQKVWEAIGAFCIPKADQCYTVGPALANILEARYGVAFSVVRNVSVRTEQKKTENLDRKILLYQGALNDGRGLPELIKVMRLLPQEVQLWIAGDGDLTEDLKKSVAQLNLGHRVLFLGMLTPVDLRQCTIQANVGINLLENKGLSYYYSLANKTFDYIQAYVPAINIAFPEYIALNEKFETAILCNDLSEASILKAIQMVFEPQVYLRLRQNCIEAAKELVWEQEKEALRKIYQRLEQS